MIEATGGRGEREGRKGAREGRVKGERASRASSSPSGSRFPAFPAPRTRIEFARRSVFTRRHVCERRRRRRRRGGPRRRQRRRIDSLRIAHSSLKARGKTDGEWTSRGRKDVNNTARRLSFVPCACTKGRERESEKAKERETLNRENVDDSMTHEVRYGSRNIGRHNGGSGGGGFAPRVLETGKVHGRRVYGRVGAWRPRSDRSSVSEGSFRARKAAM